MDTSFIDSKFYIPETNWRSAVVLSFYDGETIVKSEGLSCFWGFPKIYFNNTFDTVVHSLLNPEIKAKQLYNNTGKHVYAENINYQAIIEDTQRLFGTLFNISLSESEQHKHFIYKIEQPYPKEISFLLLTNLLSIFRYIDVDYLGTILYNYFFDEKSKIETVFDVYKYGELVKAGRVGHNANDTITATFLKLGEVVLRNYLSNLAVLTPKILLNSKYQKCVMKALKENEFEKNSNWLGQTAHYNILIDSLEVLK